MELNSNINRDDNELFLKQNELESLKSQLAEK
jgi:hypothetical protein